MLLVKCRISQEGAQPEENACRYFSLFVKSSPKFFLFVNSSCSCCRWWETQRYTAQLRIKQLYTDVFLSYSCTAEWNEVNHQNPVCLSNVKRPNWSFHQVITCMSFTTTDGTSSYLCCTFCEFPVWLLVTLTLSSVIKQSENKRVIIRLPLWCH